MDGARKSHPELGKPEPERQRGYISTYMWMLAIKSSESKL